MANLSRVRCDHIYPLGKQSIISGTGSMYRRKSIEISDSLCQISKVSSHSLLRLEYTILLSANLLYKEKNLEKTSIDCQVEVFPTSTAESRRKVGLNSTRFQTQGLISNVCRCECQHVQFTFAAFASIHGLLSFYHIMLVNDHFLWGFALFEQWPRQNLYKRFD